MTIKKINISGEIGWDVLPFMVAEQFEGVTGDVEIDLSSPGGSLFEGIEIYNMIRDYKRNNPDSQMILNIKGMAASMGSYIASNPAFDMVTIEDNATFMIHNPLMGVIGDYNDMKEAAEHLERLAIMVSEPYATKSSMKKKEIREMMDKETWFYGKEIIKAGFADEIISTKNKTSRESAIAESEVMFKKLKKKIQETEMKQSDFEKIAAITKKYDNKLDNNKEENKIVNANKPALSGEENNTQEYKMSIKNIDDLQNELPEIHAKAIKAGKEQGIKEEKERVKALLEMKNHKDFENLEMVHNRIDEGILNGESLQKVELGIMALLKRNDVQAAIDTNEIGEINTPKMESVSGEIKKEVDNRREF